MKESRKDALTRFHRDNIINASEKLFLSKGAESTTMDDIAGEAGYSKATLYVHFKNKDEIISSITLTGMKMFLELVRACIAEHKDFKSQYYALCYAIVDFQREHPFYYENILTEINVDLELEETPKIYHEIYEVGEQINLQILAMFQDGVTQGAIRKDILLPQASIIFWGSIYGITNMLMQKKKYFTKCLQISGSEFLQYSFELLYQSIQAQ